MNASERFKNRLEGKIVDKIPNFNIVMALAAKTAQVSYREYISDYKALVRGNLYCVEKFGLDCVSAISDPMREADAFGADVIFPEDAVPYCKTHLLEGTISNLSKLKLTNPYDNIRTLDRIQAIELFKKEVGDDIPIIGWAEGVLAECADLRGVSELMYDIADEEPYLDEFMQLVYQQQCLFIKAQIDAGANIIGIGNAVASLVGPSAYESYALSYDKKIIQFIHDNGALAKLHICGNITPILPLLFDVKPDILDLDWMVDHKLASSIFEKTRTCLCGNLDPVQILLRGDVLAVQNGVRTFISETNNNCILAGGCEIPALTPEENLIAMNNMLYI